MSRYKMSDVAIEINERENNPATSKYDRFVGLEHYISGDVIIRNFGSTERLESTMKVFQNGDVLVARRNVYLKRASMVDFDGLTSGDSIVLRAKNPTIGRILPFVLNTDEFWDFADQYSDGTMSKRLSPKTLMKYEFDLPAEDELEAFADLLWAANDTKEAYQALLCQTNELVKSQFIELFSIEKGWPLVKLETLCDSIVRGPFGSALKVSFFVEKGTDTVKVYEQKNAIQRSADLGESYVTQEKYQELKRFSCGPGDFIMSCSGTIGCLYQIPEGAEPGIINQALCKFHLNGKMLPEVFLTYMRNSVDQLETKGSAIKNIGAVSYIKNMEIALPTIDVQQQFAEFINQSDKSKFELKQNIENINALMKSLMQQDFV